MSFDAEVIRALESKNVSSKDSRELVVELNAMYEDLYEILVLLENNPPLADKKLVFELTNNLNLDLTVLRECVNEFDGKKSTIRKILNLLINIKGYVEILRTQFKVNVKDIAPLILRLRKKWLELSTKIQ